MSLVAIAAFALSFQSLKTLGTFSGYDDLAWLYPVVVDLGTVSSCVAWLGTKSRQAFYMTWTLLGVSVLQNGTVHWLIAAHETPEWWLITMAATVPPIVLGLTVHLGVGLSRVRDNLGATEVVAEVSEQVAEPKPRRAPEPRPRSAPPVEIEPTRGQRDVIVEWVSRQDERPKAKEIQDKYGVSRATAFRVLSDARSESG